MIFSMFVINRLFFVLQKKKEEKKHTPKSYTRPTPKKKNLAPAPSKQRKLPAKPLEMFSNILSPLSEESESN